MYTNRNVDLYVRNIDTNEWNLVTAVPECLEFDITPDNGCVAIDFGKDNVKKVVPYKYMEFFRIGNMPEKVIFSKNATVGFNSNGRKTVVLCGSEDKFDPVFGFLYLYFLMNSGMSKTQAAKFFKEFDNVNKKDIEIEKIFNNKRLGLEDYEKEMRKVIEEYVS